MQKSLKINTDFEYPPIPLRCFDWAATYDDYFYDVDGGPVGRGATEAEAIADLLESFPPDEVFVDEYSQRHGGPWDRGSADSYYSRPRDPHYWTGGTGKGERIGVSGMTPVEIAAYHAGYDDNEANGDKKDWG